MRKLFTKVCGMSAAENIAEVAAHQPDYLGFIFYPKSPRGIELGHALDFPKVIIPVAVVVNESLEFLKELKSTYGFTHVQLHGDETPEFCSEVKELDFTIFKAFNVKEQADFERVKDYEEVIDVTLYDTKGDKVGGNGLKFSWELLENHPLSCPFLLSGGIAESDASGVLDTFKRYPKMMGVDVNSKFETSPGIKDADSIGRFLGDLREG